MDAEVSNDPGLTNILFVLVTATLFYYGARIRSAMSAKAKELFRAPKTDPKVLALLQQIRILEAELSAISPTAEFAAYFKKDRQLNKMKDELQTIVGSADPAVARARQMEGMKVELAVQVVFQAVGLALLYFAGGIFVFCVDTTTFWPANRLLRFPSVFSSSNVCGGPESGLTPVSYFVMFYLLAAVADNVTRCFI